MTISLHDASIVGLPFDGDAIGGVAGPNTGLVSGLAIFLYIKNISVMILILILI